MRYEKTNDPNVVKQIETVENEIYLDKLRVAIAKTEVDIESYKPKKECPENASDEMREVYDFYNVMHPTQAGMSKLEKSLTEMQAILVECEAL